MNKLMKYEIKDNFKSFIMTFILMIILNTALYFKLGDWRKDSIFVLTTLVNASAFIVVLIFSIKAFSKELYDDRGYLTFTLPIKGSEIVLSKLFITLFWFVITAIIVFIFQYSLLKHIIPPEILIRINEYINIKIILTTVVIGIYSIASLLILIYFSITISKVTFKNKKIGKVLGFITFLVLNFILNIIDFFLIKTFPQRFNLDIEVLEKISMTNNTSIATYTSFNIATTIFGILTLVAFFLLTSNFLDKRIEI